MPWLWTDLFEHGDVVGGFDDLDLTDLFEHDDVVGGFDELVFLRHNDDGVC